MRKQFVHIFHNRGVQGSAVDPEPRLTKHDMPSSVKALNLKREFDWVELFAWGPWEVLPHLFFGKPSREFQQELREFIGLIGFGYLSHLALDIITPMGLSIA